MQIAPGVHRLGTKFINYYVIEEGGRLTLVDAGLPGYALFLLDFLSASGHALDDVEAVVLTHGHVDHVGFAERLRAAEGSRVLVHEADGPLVAGTERTPMPRGPLTPHLIRYILHGVRFGGLRFPAVLEAETFEDGDTLDVPGRPRVIHTPGHTKGSCSLQSGRVLFAGDALATVDIMTGTPGMRIAPSFVNDDSEQALRSLDRLVGLDVDTVLVGHGEPWTDGIDEAVRQARETGIW